METLDFNAEGRRLCAALGLDGSRRSMYRDMDKLYQDRRTGSSVFIGNEASSRGPMASFERHNITHIVNCTDDLPDHFAGRGLRYMRFDIASHLRVSGKPSTLAAFVGSLFAFVESALEQGGSVLIHCLAGAHRAGTAGCLLLMHKDGISAEESVRAAQALRPIINPIGQLPLLLERFGKLRDQAHERVWAEAEEARAAQEQRLRALVRTEGEGKGGDEEEEESDPLLEDSEDDDLQNAWAKAERARVAQERRLRGRAATSAAADACGEEEEEEEEAAVAAADEPTLNQCIAALGAIGRRAHNARRELYAEVLRSERLELGKGSGARGAGGWEEAEEAEEPEEEGDDDFEEFESDDGEEEFFVVSRSAGEEDLSELQAAVDDSRRAVREAEQRLAVAEADEPRREAEVADTRRSPLAPLAHSLATALGVSHEEAHEALARSDGDLEAALVELARHVTPPHLDP
jgi:hypothetical protein